MESSDAAVEDTTPTGTHSQADLNASEGISRQFLHLCSKINKLEKGNDYSKANSSFI